MGIKKVACSIFFMLCFCFLTYSTRGNDCDYPAYGDSECDARAGYYCIDGACTLYSGSTSEYCTDSDGDSPETAGSVSYLYRSSTGAFV